MKKLMMIIFLAVTMLCGCNTDAISLMPHDVSEGIIGDDLSVERGYAAKMLALSRLTKSEINSLERTAAFSDTNAGMWYDKYINAVCRLGIMSGKDENSFKPEENLTLSEVQSIIDTYSDSGIKIKMTDETKDKPVSMALFNEVYMKITEPSREKVIIFAANGDNPNIPEGYAVTDRGLICFDGIDIQAFSGTEIECILKGSDAVTLISVTDMQPFFRNVYINSVSENSATAFYGGASRTFMCDNPTGSGMICDIRIDNGSIIEISPYNDKISGKLIGYDDDTVFIDSVGEMKKSENFAVYEKGGEIKSRENIAVGMNYEFTVHDGMVCGVVYEREIPENIRIFMGNNIDIKLSSENDIKIKGNGNEKLCEGEVAVNNIDWNYFGNRVVISSQSGISGYNGNLEIIKKDDKFYVINDMPIEQLLYGLIEGEPEEYLKAMAVIQRTRLVNDIYESKMHESYANIDNSGYTYNYAEENISAVDATRGKILMNYDGIIKPNYFAVSCGKTADGGSLWADSVSRAFPSDIPYLKSVSVAEEEFEDMSDEKNMTEFISDRNINSYDSGNEWFRWIYKVSFEDINKALEKDIFEKYPDFALKSGEIGSSIEEIEVERGRGGNAQTVKIRTDKGSIILETESVIREFLSAEGEILKNGMTEYEECSQLPSVYFIVSKDENGFVFTGGGKGHGCGLSINAAQNMAYEGKNYEEILTKFYNASFVS